MLFGKARLLTFPFVLSKIFARRSKGRIEKQGVSVSVRELLLDKDRLSTGVDIEPVV